MTKSEVKFLPLDEIQKELLGTLIAFDGFCRERGLRYSLEAGTLLGAVRHKGFIPWDADVDVLMPRPDYERLLEFREELPHGFDLVDCEGTGFAYPFAKWRNLGIRAQEAAYKGMLEGYLWVDVFPFDGLPAEGVSGKWLKRLHRIKRKIVWLSINNGEVYRGSLVKRMVAQLYAALPFRQSRRKALIAKFNRLISCCNWDSADRVANLCSDAIVDFTLDKRDFESFDSMEFEEAEFPVVSCWQDLLKGYYGDYMKLPPVEGRIDHHDFVAWRAAGDAQYPTRVQNVATIERDILD